MQVGVPREIKDHEYRVGLTPAGVHALCERGHQVCVETGAGTRVGFSDADYLAAGARIAASAKDIFAADMVVKVKELQAAEFSLPRRGQILFAKNLILLAGRPVLDRTGLLITRCHEDAGQQQHEADQLEHGEAFFEKEPREDRSADRFAQYRDRDKCCSQSPQCPIECCVSDQLRAERKRNHE